MSELRKNGEIIDFNKDFHPEFNGWIGEKEKGVWISFIVSVDKRKGNFSKLLVEFKKKYDWIKIPTPSYLMEKICLNKDFIKKREYVEKLGEVIEYLLWVKK